MTTTELIELLKKHERGGATGRPREVMFDVDDRIIDTDGIEVTGSGDGLVTELYLSLPDAEPHWILCSERLPEVDEEVLATTVWNDVTIAWRIGVDKWFIHDGGTNATTEDLIAWMPLPEPYRKDGEADR